MKRWSSEKLRWNRKLITLGAVALLLMGAIAANFFLGGKKKAPAKNSSAIPKLA